MTKHDAMKAYFEPKVEELVGDLLNFNFSPESPDSIAMITNYSDKVRKKYIRCGSEKEYGFTILITKTYSSEQDDLNLEAMNFCQAFMDWLEDQDRKKNYPEFPDSCQIRKMECLQNMPNLAGVNAEEGLARYMIQCRIIYFEKERN
ncbi:MULTISPECIES: hypothetical protein [unclassified Candidatus Paralachnospira]|uniref:hypothetical protein n=1 Tax=unclassified Candidatus Paralachnospira TaxID=3099471 RepID=UPI003F92F7C0